MICHQRYYIVTDCIPHTVRFVPVTHLLYDLISLTYFSPLPTPLCSGSHLFSAAHAVFESDPFIPILPLDPLTPHQISSFQPFILNFPTKILLTNEKQVIVIFRPKFLLFVPFLRDLVCFFCTSLECKGQHFFRKGPDDKYFKLCRPCSLCIQHCCIAPKQPYAVCKQMYVVVFQ